MAEKTMNIREKLVLVQSELKAPKNQFNKFGNYHYRSLEDIAEAVKPLLLKYGLALSMDDEIVMIGERYYLKATATLLDTTSDGYIVCHAMAREALDAKGMSEPQLTGSSSSYARKYCLNAMFLIDDVKDDDSNESQDEKQNRNKRKFDKPKEPELISEKDKEILRKTVEDKGYTVEQIFPKGIDGLTADQYAKAMVQLKGMKAKQ